LGRWCSVILRYVMRLLKLGRVYYFDYRDERGRHTKAIHRYFKIPHPITDRVSAEKLLARAVTDYVNLAAGLKEKQVNLRWLFTEWLRAGSLHWTKRTSQTHYQRIQTFLRWTEERKILDTSQLTTGYLRQFIAENTFKPVTANRYIRAIFIAYNWGVREGILSSFPFKQYKFFSERREKVKRVFTQEELKKLFRSPPPFSDLIQLTYFCLLRRSEVCFLTWEDIDFQKGILLVQSKPGFRPKSGKLRMVPLNSQAIGVLKRLRHLSGGKYTNSVNLLISDLIFPWWSTDAISHKFIKLCKRLQIKGRLHDLRHTAASNLAEAGVSMKAVQTLLGHSDIKTTLEIYTHVSDDYLKKAVTRLYSTFTPSKRNNREQWGLMGINEDSGINRPKALSTQLITSD